MNITNDYNDFSISTEITDNENDNNNIILKHSLLSIPGVALLLSPRGLIIWSTPKPLFS